MTLPARARERPAEPTRIFSALLAGGAAQVAGVVWILQWAHALVAHGPTQVDQKELWLGMTWMDSSKFLALAFLLLIPGVVFVARRAGAAGRRRTHLLGTVTIGVLVAAALGTALEMGPFPWGSYRSSTGIGATLAGFGGPLGALSRGIVLPLAWVAFGIGASRAQAMPSWLPPVLGVGSLFAFFVGGPLPPVAGFAWLVFGGWLLTQAHRRPGSDEQRP